MGCNVSTHGPREHAPPSRILHYQETNAGLQLRDKDLQGERVDTDADGEERPLVAALRARRWADARTAAANTPQAACCEDPDTGDLPLHVILRSRPVRGSLRNLQAKDGAMIESFLEACKTIVEAFPEACERHGSTLTDSGGALPLHLVCMNQAMNHVWSPQLEARLCRYRCEVMTCKLIDLIVSAFPAACQEPAPPGLRHMMRPIHGLPLHIAIACQATESTIDRLLTEYPAACRNATPSGEYPLHLAVEHHATPKLIRNLVRLFPEACAVEEQLGLLPLHIALKKSGEPSTLEIVEELVATHPAACEQYEHGQNLPLHLACKHSHKVDPAIIEGMLHLLVAQHPTACSETDSNNELPLHHAIRQKMSARGIRYLLETHPTACLTPDKDGKLPLHAVVTDVDHDVETVRAMVKHCPSACVHADSHGDLPIHAGIRILRRHNEPDTAKLDELFKANTKSLLMKNAELHTPVDMACDSKERLKEWAITCGAFLRRYRITSEIKTSGSKILFGRDELSSSSSSRCVEVCLKCVRDRMTLEKEVRQRCERPALLSSNAIVSVLHWHTPENDSFSLGGSAEEAQHTQMDDEYRYVIVMPRAECTLHEACHNERLARYNLPGIRSCMRQVGRCLQALHDEELVHGDLKKRNILRMRDSKGEAFYVLCDLNASNVVGETLGWTSPAYAPPELAKIQCTCPCRSETLTWRSQMCKACRMQSVEKSFDVWSFGVVLFEMCAGRTLFRQDVSNDDLVDEIDCCRLCVWLTISDEELEPILSSSSVAVSEAERAAAKHLVRWCLSSDPLLRPSIGEILEHQFFSVDSTLPAPQPTMQLRYHGFMSHAQADASGTVGTLYLMYKQLGLHNWLDMHQELLTLDAMRQGVRESSVFILILTESVLRSWFCQQEIKEALREGKPIQLIIEEDDRFEPFDEKKWKQTRFRARVLEWGGDTGLPVEICSMIDDNLHNAVTFRRRNFEAESMMRELCRRSGLTLPLVKKSAALAKARKSAALAPMGKADTLSVFVVYHKETGFKILRVLQAELEKRKCDRDYGQNIELMTQPEMLHNADSVLLLLTPGVLQEPSLGQLQQVLAQSMEDHKDRLSVLFSQYDGWTFKPKAVEHQNAPPAVQACLDQHEAIAWRPPDPDGRHRHEFPAMVDQLVKQVIPGTRSRPID